MNLVLKRRISAHSSLKYSPIRKYWLRFAPRLNKNPLFSKSLTANRGEFEGFSVRSGEGMLPPCENERAEKRRSIPLCGGFKFSCSPYVNFQTKHITPADELIFPDGFEFYHPKAAIQKRNRYMVDRSAYAVCYVQHSWGCAAQTLDYIKRKQIQCIAIRPLPPENR